MPAVFDSPFRCSLIVNELNLERVRKGKSMRHTSELLLLQTTVYALDFVALIFLYEHSFLMFFWKYLILSMHNCKNILGH